MNISEITASNLEKYTDILGSVMAESVGRNGFTTLTAGEKCDNAIMWRSPQFYDNNEVIEIFFFKTADKREGKELLLELVRRNSLGGIKQYHFFMEDLGTIEKELLSTFGFEIKKVESRDITGRISDIQTGGMEEMFKETDIINIENLSYSEFREHLTRCLLKNKRGLNEDIAFLPMRWYDQDVSCAIRRDEEVTGLFLVHRLPNGVFEPVFLHSSGKAPAKDMIAMISFALSKARKKYTGDALVKVCRRNTEIRAMAGRMFKNIEPKKVFEGFAKL